MLPDSIAEEAIPKRYGLAPSEAVPPDKYNKVDGLPVFCF